MFYLQLENITIMIVIHFIYVCSFHDAERQLQERNQHIENMCGKTVSSENRNSSEQVSFDW